MKLGKNMISRNPKAAWQEVDDKIVVVTPHTRKIHILHGSGSDIWKRLSNSREFESIVEFLASEYNIEVKEAYGDVENFCAELIEKDVIQCA